MRAGASRDGRAQAARLRLAAGPAVRTMKAMEVTLTHDQQALICRVIESGRLAREEDAVKEARSLMGGARTHAYGNPCRHR